MLSAPLDDVVIFLIGQLREPKVFIERCIHFVSDWLPVSDDICSLLNIFQAFNINIFFIKIYLSRQLSISSIIFQLISQLQQRLRDFLIFFSSSVVFSVICFHNTFCSSCSRACPMSVQRRISIYRQHVLVVLAGIFDNCICYLSIQNFIFCLTMLQCLLIIIHHDNPFYIKLFCRSNVRSMLLQQYFSYNVYLFLILVLSSCVSKVEELISGLDTNIVFESEGILQLWITNKKKGIHNSTKSSQSFLGQCSLY